ncbi:hypothetical protein ACLB2K_001970 [Fragaria x ananassa]
MDSDDGKTTSMDSDDELADYEFIDNDSDDNSSFIICGDGPKVAKSLVDVYFALFKVLISEAGGGDKTEKTDKVGGKKPPGSLKDGKGKKSSDTHVELDSRLLSALLMGVNRAFPYVSKNEADDLVEAQTPTLFHLVHSTNFNVGVQALMLLHHISSKNQIVSDRFYRALYSKLLLPAAMNTSKAETFIGLLLRAMKSDVNVKRTAAFAKRLLQNAVDMALADSECNKHENSELRLSCFFNKAHDLLKLYDRVDVPPERLLFKIPSTWQGSSCFVPTNLEILNCPLFYVYRRHHNMFRQFSFSLCT